MMLSTLKGALAAVLVFASVSYSEVAHACACCTDSGQRFVGSEKIDAYAAGLLTEVAFAGTARLYVGESDIKDVAGIDAKSAEFRLAVKKGERSWELAFTEEGGGGTLTFAVPKTVTKFEVDPRDPDDISNGHAPVLYKEWRLTAPARGTGMFKGATGGDQQATLILHGRGNSCTDATQFNAWTLVLHGSKARATLFGVLSPQ